MKRILLHLSALLLLAGAAAAAERQATIEVGGLTCPSCPYIAAQMLESVDSVTIIDGAYDADAELARFVVTYDDALTSPEAIAAAPGQYGYPGRVLGEDPGS